jgi:hypothetical protein
VTPASKTPPAPTRPNFPPGYGIKPSTEGRLIDWPSVEVKLRDARTYWLITASPDGIPHAAPLWGLWQEGSFFFGTDPSSRKALNIRRNNAVTVHLESGDDVVILEGIAHRETDDGLIARLDKVYRDKYGFPLQGNPVSRADVHTAFAWAEADFPESATRWRFPASRHSADA